MRSTLKAVAGLFLLLLTSACLVETEATIADPDPKAMDLRLAGSWYYSSKGEVVLLTTVADEKEEGVYRVVFANVRPGRDEPIRTTVYRAWRTVINGHGYLTLQAVSNGDPEMPNRTVIAYDLDAENNLVLRVMDTKAAAAAIESGKLKGAVRKGQYTDRVTISSPRAEFAAFIAGADREKLFSNKTGAMRRTVDTAN